PLIVLIHHGSAHHVGAVHLSTEDLELQVERLLEVRQAAATFLDRNELKLPTNPDLVPPPIEREAELERPLDGDVLARDSHRFGGKLVVERAPTLRQVFQIDLHGRDRSAAPPAPARRRKESRSARTRGSPRREPRCSVWIRRRARGSCPAWPPSDPSRRSARGGTGSRCRGGAGRGRRGRTT